jgi:uncharacterized membrane protein
MIVGFVFGGCCVAFFLFSKERKRFVARLSRRVRLTARIAWWLVCTGGVLQEGFNHETWWAVVWMANWTFCFVEWSTREGAWTK